MTDKIEQELNQRKGRTETQNETFDRSSMNDVFICSVGVLFRGVPPNVFLRCLCLHSLLLWGEKMLLLWKRIKYVTVQRQ